MKNPDQGIITQATLDQKLWHVESTGPHESGGIFVNLATRNGDRLHMRFSAAGSLTKVYYHWWDKESRRTSYSRAVTKDKRAYVLRLLDAERGRDGRLYIRQASDQPRARIGSIAEGMYENRRVQL